MSSPRNPCGRTSIQISEAINPIDFEELEDDVAMRTTYRYIRFPPRLAPRNSTLEAAPIVRQHRSDEQREQHGSPENRPSENVSDEYRPPAYQTPPMVVYWKPCFNYSPQLKGTDAPYLQSRGRQYTNGNYARATPQWVPLMPAATRTAPVPREPPQFIHHNPFQVVSYSKGQQHVHRNVPRRDIFYQPDQYMHEPDEEYGEELHSQEMGDVQIEYEDEPNYIYQQTFIQQFPEQEPSHERNQREGIFKPEQQHILCYQYHNHQFPRENALIHQGCIEQRPFQRGMWLPEFYHPSPCYTQESYQQELSHQGAYQRAWRKEPQKQKIFQPRKRNFRHVRETTSAHLELTNPSIPRLSLYRLKSNTHVGLNYLIEQKELPKQDADKKHSFDRGNIYHESLSEQIYRFPKPKEPVWSKTWWGNKNRQEQEDQSKEEQPQEDEVDEQYQDPSANPKQWLNLWLIKNEEDENEGNKNLKEGDEEFEMERIQMEIMKLIESDEESWEIFRASVNQKIKISEENKRGRTENMNVEQSKSNYLLLNEAFLHIPLYERKGNDKQKPNTENEKKESEPNDQSLFKILGELLMVTAQLSETPEELRQNWIELCDLINNIPVPIETAAFSGNEQGSIALKNDTSQITPTIENAEGNSSGSEEDTDEKTLTPSTPTNSYTIEEYERSESCGSNEVLANPKLKETLLEKLISLFKSQKSPIAQSSMALFLLEVMRDTNEKRRANTMPAAGQSEKNRLTSTLLPIIRRLTLNFSNINETVEFDAEPQLPTEEQARTTDEQIQEQSKPEGVPEGMITYQNPFDFGFPKVTFFSPQQRNDNSHEESSDRPSYFRVFSENTRTKNDNEQEKTMIQNEPSIWSPYPPFPFQTKTDDETTQKSRNNDVAPERMVTYQNPFDFGLPPVALFGTSQQKPQVCNDSFHKESPSTSFNTVDPNRPSYVGVSDENKRYNYASDFNDGEKFPLQQSEEQKNAMRQNELFVVHQQIQDEDKAIFPLYHLFPLQTKIDEERIEKSTAEGAPEQIITYSNPFDFGMPPVAIFTKNQQKAQIHKDTFDQVSAADEENRPEHDGTREHSANYSSDNSDKKNDTKLDYNKNKTTHDADPEEDTEYIFRSLNGTKKDNEKRNGNERFISLKPTIFMFEPESPDGTEPTLYYQFYEVSDAAVTVALPLRNYKVRIGHRLISVPIPTTQEEFDKLLEECNSLPLPFGTEHLPTIDPYPSTTNDAAAIMHSTIEDCRQNSLNADLRPKEEQCNFPQCCENYVVTQPVNQETTNDTLVRVIRRIDDKILDTNNINTFTESELSTDDELHGDDPSAYMNSIWQGPDKINFTAFPQSSTDINQLK